MSHILAESGSHANFTGPVIVPDVGDVIRSAIPDGAFQQLADRTRYVFDNFIGGSGSKPSFDNNTIVGNLLVLSGTMVASGSLEFTGDTSVLFASGSQVFAVGTNLNTDSSSVVDVFGILNIDGPSSQLNLVSDALAQVDPSSEIQIFGTASIETSGFLTTVGAGFIKIDASGSIQIFPAGILETIPGGFVTINNNTPSDFKIKHQPIFITNRSKDLVKFCFDGGFPTTAAVGASHVADNTWYLTGNATLVCNDPVGTNGNKWSMPLVVHDTSTLGSIDIAFVISTPGRTAPGTRLKFSVQRWGFGNIAPDDLIAAGSVTVGAGVYALAGTQVFTITCDQNNTIDTTLYSYVLNIFNEQGSNYLQAGTNFINVTIHNLAIGGDNWPE